MPDPAVDIAAHIASLIPSLTVGTNLFSSKPRAPRGDVPQDAVFVWTGAGRVPDRVMSYADEIRWPIVMVAIRHSRQQSGSALAQSILNTLRGTVPAGYLDLTSVLSAPIDNGYDSDGRHHFMLTFTTPYLET